MSQDRKEFELYEHTHPTARTEGRLPIGLEDGLEMAASVIETQNLCSKMETCIDITVL
jgi:hypothetical protein